MGDNMGRSVNYLNNAEVVLYFPFENEYFENGEYNEYLSQMNWDDMVINISAEIRAKLPSYYKVDKWDNRETKIILENNLCVIGISEYCGLVSLSVAPRDSDNLDSFSTFRDNFAVSHANQIEKTLRKILEDLGLTNLRKVGSIFI
jgi:hypothetical protein